MLKHKWIERICWIVVFTAVLIVGLYLLALNNGSIREKQTLGYIERLFDTTVVHTIDIKMEDWEDFLSTCINEEYTTCDIVIDGETYGNVAIRAKGNTSLTSVAAYGNDRYSFKVEFDHYSSGNTYYGLDKLNLNNLIQDNTCLKDYLCYTMMNDIGIAAPLCSFVYITVNGEDWGLYLAVEGVEEAFLQRNYGVVYGELYKPDSMNIGGGRGNGQGFAFDEMWEDFPTEEARDMELNIASLDDIAGERQNMPPGRMENPPNSEDMGDREEVDDKQVPDTEGPGWEQGNRFPGGRGGGMNQADVMLQYIDDDPDSYANIFDNAKTDSNAADQERLIASLKALSQGDTSVVDVDAVLRYLVVHNFVCNGDSYTGSMVHNYYLYEEDGVLSMIPWDYNLAFGAFEQGGGSTEVDQATNQVNSPIDSPVSGGDLSSRPMVAWIFQDTTYIELYHQYYQQFITDYFEQGVFEQKFEAIVQLISPYVEKDPTAFCTYDEFLIAVDTLREFCLLRAESISEQLDGTIPSTTEGQNQDVSSLIDASHIVISDMGSMGMGGGGMQPFFSNSDDRMEDQSSESPFAANFPEDLDENQQLTESDDMPLGTFDRDKLDSPDNAQDGERIEPFAENEAAEMNASQQFTPGRQENGDMAPSQSGFNPWYDPSSPGSNRTLLLFSILTVGTLAVGLIVAFLWRR